jgi:hypothetical protein
MGVANVPSAAGGGIKSVQRGSAGGAGNVTITAVDIAKSFVTVFGTASSGTVAATGAVGAATGNAAATTGSLMKRTAGYNSNFANDGNFNGQMGELTLPIQAVTLNAVNITGGTNNLVAAVVQGFLANSTTLTVSGACRYEVVEFA